MEQSDLDLLEELLSVTEPCKDLLEPEYRKRWQEISAECADRRIKSTEFHDEMPA